MVPPPKRVDAVEVHNSSKHPVTFKVTYDNHKDQAEIHEEHVVQPGQTHLFGEKELNMGSWTAIAPVVKVSAEGPGGPQLLQPNVSGVVKVLKVTAGDSGGKLTLAQAH